MAQDLFDLLEHTSGSEGMDAALGRLIAELREQKRYQLIFEIRLLQKRAALGLPLIFTGTIADLPADKRDLYQAALVEAAREAGHSFLADGDIERAWTYFRAIGEPAPVAAAIERVTSKEDSERILSIALLEDVNPRRGYELLLEHRGLCQGTDFAVKSTDPQKRIMFLQMLVRAFYAQLVANLKEAIAEVEGSVPTAERVSDLIADRDWLFEGGRLYIENSHLISILQASPDIPDLDTRRLVLELAEYAQRLAPLHHVDGEPPFDDVFVDFAEYLRALSGEQVDRALAHFRQKLSFDEPATADVLVSLLARTGRYEEAIQVSVEYLRGEAGDRCPSATALCQMAGDYSRLREVARQENDLIGFAAGIIQTTPRL